MQVTSLGFLTDLAVREAEGAQISDRGGYLVVRSPEIPDFWWGNFLLLAGWPGPGTADSWLARFAAEFPRAGHIALGVDATREQPDMAAEFGAAGLNLDRACVLTCAAVEPPPHPNTTAAFRRLESDADWAQSVELTMRCFDDDPGDYPARRAVPRRRLARSGRGAWFGAFAGGRLLAQLGLVDAGGGLARYQHVETDPGARRQGLAGTLVWHAGRWGREALGAGTFVIVADPDDAAIRVYRSCGFAGRQAQFSFERPPG